MKKSTIPTILGIFFLTVGIAIGVILINNKQIFKLRASPEIIPKDIRFSNITEYSFTISWITDKETQGFIRWGEKSSPLRNTQLNSSTTASFTHSLSISGLTPSTVYYLKINSDGTDFDNNGIPWQTKTGVEIPNKPEANVISGNINTQVGSPVKGALVYVTIGGSSLLSGTTDENGGWIVPISNARIQTLDSYLPINETTSLIEIFVHGGPLGTASAQIYPVSAKPAPPIVLGQTNNFKTLQSKSEEEIPEAAIELPEESPSSSKLVSPEVTLIPTKTVTLENIKEGEVLQDSKPEFVGTGPTGIILTIKIESNPITDEVEIGSKGNWNWISPTNLSAGTHKITLEWKDTRGILRRLSRTFIVQAAEELSVTPTPTPTSTATPTPTPTSTPTPTLKKATESALPASGVLTPTLVLFIISLASLALGGLILSLSTEKGSDSSS